MTHTPSARGIDRCAAMSRRRLLQVSALGGLLPVAWRLGAAPAAAHDARFVLVFLRGAYDAISALVPYREPHYHEARPNIAIAAPPAEGLPDEEACVPLDTRWGLHPALSRTLLPLWQKGQIAFVPFSGTGFVSRSHFEAQDRMEYGQAPSARPDHASGFMNRLLGVLGGEKHAVAFTGGLPPALRGSVAVANAPFGTRRDGPPPEDEFLELAQSMYRGHALEPLVRDGLALRQQVAQSVSNEMEAASRGAGPATLLAQESARIARLLRERPEFALGFVEIGGWDTHANQGAAQGRLARQLAALGEGLAMLASELGAAEWRRTVVAVVSEFGRTWRENGSRGTDHGHGSVIWLLGGALHGGRIVGEQASLGPADLHQGRDIPVLNEYREVLASVLRAMYGLQAGALATVFPGVGLEWNAGRELV